MGIIHGEDIGLRTIHNRIRKIEHELAKLNLTDQRRALLEGRLAIERAEKERVLTEFGLAMVASQ